MFSVNRPWTNWFWSDMCSSNPLQIRQPASCCWRPTGSPFCRYVTSFGKAIRSKIIKHFVIFACRWKSKNHKYCDKYCLDWFIYCFVISLHQGKICNWCHQEKTKWQKSTCSALCSWGKCHSSVMLSTVDQGLSNWEVKKLRKTVFNVKKLIM